MQVSAMEFIKSPAIYLDKVDMESVQITRGGRTIAVLVKPGNTPVVDSLLGIFKGTGIKDAEELKAERLDV